MLKYPYREAYMESKGISFGSTIREAWSLFKIHWKYFLGFLLLMSLIYGGAIGLLSLLPESYAWLHVLLFIVVLLVYFTMWIGYLYASIKAVRGIPLSYSDLLGNYKKLFSFIAGYIMYMIIVLVGLVLLIVPGIIWAIKYFFWPYYVVEKGQGPIKSLELSSEATKGFKWDIFLAYIGWLVLSFLVLLPFLLILGFSGAGAAYAEEFKNGVNLISGIGFGLGTLGIAVLGFLLSILQTLFFASIYKKVDDHLNHL